MIPKRKGHLGRLAELAFVGAINAGDISPGKEDPHYKPNTEFLPREVDLRITARDGMEETNPGGGQRDGLNPPHLEGLRFR